MELKQLRYFLVLCEELHFSEAAFRLGISQPSLSQQIKNLESEVGLLLFDRIGKKNSQTEAGRRLEFYARKIIHTIQDAELAIEDLKTGGSGQIRVAMLPSDLDYRLSQMLAEFHQTYPEVKVTVIPSLEIEQLLMKNQVDLGVGLLRSPSKQLNQESIFTETYGLFVPKTHPLSQVKSIQGKDLEKLPLLLYPSGFYGRQLIDQWAQERKLSLETVMETGSASSQFQLTEKGVGLTIQPQHLIGELGTENLVAIEISDGPIREVAISYLKDRYISKVMLDFMAAVSLIF